MSFFILDTLKECQWYFFSAPSVEIQTHFTLSDMSTLLLSSLIDLNRHFTYSPWFIHAFTNIFIHFLLQFVLVFFSRVWHQFMINRPLRFRIKWFSLLCWFNFRIICWNGFRAPIFLHVFESHECFQTSIHIHGKIQWFQINGVQVNLWCVHSDR